MYIYYHPWKREVRETYELNTTLSKLGYSLIPESAVCMVRKIISISNIYCVIHLLLTKCHKNHDLFIIHIFREKTIHCNLVSLHWKHLQLQSYTSFQLSYYPLFTRGIFDILFMHVLIKTNIKLGRRVLKLILYPNYHFRISSALSESRRFENPQEAENKPERYDNLKSAIRMQSKYFPLFIFYFILTYFIK